jgi:thymidylate synthase (FAD)
MIEALLESSWNDETTVLDSARISVTNRLVGGQDLTADDIKLLRELMYFEHHVPFETIMLRWRISSPIFSIRQLVKHRISSISEKSKRYRGDVAECYIPDAEACYVDDFKVFTESDREIMVTALNDLATTREHILTRMYDRIELARADGNLPPDPKTGRDPWRARAREIARGLQPVSERTDLYFTLNFRSLMNFLWLRTSEHAQYEIRILADQMYKAMEGQYPVLMEVYKEYMEAKTEMQSNLEKQFNEKHPRLTAV